MSDKEHVPRGGQGLILHYTPLPQGMGMGGIAPCKAEKERKKDHRASEQPVAAHTSSSQSQWADADEHPHKPQHWGWASLKQRRSSTAGKYIHTQRDISSLSIDTDIKIQGDKDGLLSRTVFARFPSEGSGSPAIFTVPCTVQLMS